MIKMSNQCLYCEKYYSNKPNLSRHQPICPALKLYHSNQTLKEELVQQQARCDEQKEHYEQKFQTLQEQHEKELRSQREFVQTLQEQHEKELRSLKEQLIEFKTQLFEIAKQPKTVTTHNTTTTQNNSRNTAIINQLAPFDLTKDWITQMFHQHFNLDTFHGGPDEIAKLTAQVILTDPESQKPKVVCTDISRKNFRYVENGEQQELQVDPGFQRTHALIKEPLSKANIRMYVDELKCDDRYRDQWRKNEDFIADRTGFSDKMLKFM